MLPITNSETMMHFYRNNNALEIVTIKSIQSNFKQLFDIKVSYTCGMCYILNAKNLAPPTFLHFFLQIENFFEILKLSFT